LVNRRWWDEDKITAAYEPAPALNPAPDAQTIGDGVGDALTRRYDIDLHAAPRTPRQVLEEFRQHPDRFSPTSYAAFGTAELETGDRFTIELAGPWNGPVEVAEVSDSRIRLVTLDGHMEAGYIDFCAVENAQRRVLRIESTARAGDPGFWLLHDALPIGRWVQTDMWARVLEKAATAAGLPAPPQVHVRTVRHRE